MSRPRKSLNADVDVPALLRRLGCSVRQGALPLRVRCPICREGSLTVYRDDACGGGWHACNHCASQGDLLALAARTLNVTVPDAIADLAAHGFDIPADDASVRRYLEEYVEYDARLMELWKSAQQGLSHPPAGVGGVVQRLGIHIPNWTSRLQDGVGQLVGFLTKTEIEECFQPQVMRNQKLKHRSTSNSTDRVFHGPNWDSVVAVPFFDQPGRISCFLLIGREADPKFDYIVKRANRGTRDNQYFRPDAEAGLALHPGIYRAAEARNRTVVAVGNPQLMLRLQIRHFQTHLSPLPIAGWFDSGRWCDWRTLGRRTRTMSAWQMLSGYRLVFWAPMGSDAYTLHQAVSTEGWISKAGPRRSDAQALSQYIRNTDPDQLWEQIVKKARPWPDAVADDLKKWDDPQIYKWLAQMRHEGEPLEPILARLSGPVRKRVEALINAEACPRTIAFDRHTILEANRSWYLQRKGFPRALICDAVLRLDQLLRDPDHDQTFVRGRILYREHEVKVFEPFKTIEQDPLRYMQEELLDAGLGLMQSDYHYSTRLLQIARSFQEPQIADAETRVGWNAKACRLVLPQFAIDSRGKVLDLHGELIAADAPASRLERPREICGTDLDKATGDAEFARLFWATMACTVANILAPRFTLRPAGICLVGCGAEAVGTAVATACGCLRSRAHDAESVRRALADEQVHDWPLIVDTGPDLQRRHLWKLLEDRGAERRSIIATDWLTSRLLAMHDSWQKSWDFITCDHRVAVRDSALNLAEVFLPAYLEDVALRSFWIDAGTFDSLSLRLLHDMAHFVERRHGNPELVRSGSSVIFASRGNDRRLMIIDILGRLIQDGKLKVGTKVVGRRKSTMKERLGDDAFELSYPAFVAALNDVAVPLPGPEEFNALLHETGMVVESTGEVFVLQRTEMLQRWIWSEKLLGKPLGAAAVDVDHRMMLTTGAAADAIPPHTAGTGLGIAATSDS